MKRGSVLAFMAGCFLAASGLAQEDISWKRIQIPGVPFSVEMPYGGDITHHDVSLSKDATGGRAPGEQITLDRLENIIRVQYSEKWDNHRTGFEYYTGYPFEDRRLLDTHWGKIETRSLEGYVVREVGEKLGPSSAFPRPRWNIYTIVEMGPQTFMTVELSCLDADMHRYARLYMRIRDSLQPISARAKGRKRR